jgi:anion-transporting  ArsA/GET3 family ATPase
MPEPGPLDLSALAVDPSIQVVVCCGSGGVGKTTTAAALGLHAAERGRRAVVLTIDPARRLASSLGLTELDNTPRPVRGVGGGSLDAMMLDMKRTFDEVVLAHTSKEKAEQIFENPFYQALSSSFAGTQEYMAMEKLGQLRAAGKWDLIVVDTPPSRSALDFLDAPQRLGRFLDGRMIRLLTAPAKVGGRVGVRVVGAGFAIFGRAMTRIVGTQTLSDISAFVASLETMFGGFRERAQTTYELLRKSDTAFVVVATPAPDALREASFFVDRLSDEQMPLAGLVLNRSHSSFGGPLNRARAEAAADVLGTEKADVPGARMAAAILRGYAERVRQAEAERRLVARFHRTHPAVRFAEVPALPTDVHDLDGLRAVGNAFGSPASQAAVEARQGDPQWAPQPDAAPGGPRPPRG